jgi:hypothetical protein
VTLPIVQVLVPVDVQMAVLQATASARVARPSVRASTSSVVSVKVF